LLENAYATEAMSRATLFQWWNYCKARNTRVLDDAQCGRPSNADKGVNIDEANLMMKEERRLSLRELCVSLNVSLECAHHNIILEKGMKKECALWVHCHLCDE
jgi:hypothetical protein